MNHIKHARELLWEIQKSRKDMQSTQDKIDEVIDIANFLLNRSRKVDNIKISLKLYDVADSLMAELTKAVIS